MSYSMYQKFIFIFLIIFLITSCSRDKDLGAIIPPDKNESFEIYKEAVEAMNEGDFFYASKKFSEAEAILPKIENCPRNRN